MAAQMVTIVLLTRKRVAVVCVGVGIQSYRDKKTKLQLESKENVSAFSY